MSSPYTITDVDDTSIRQELEWPIKFLVPDAIVYTVDGEVVGRIDAVYEVREGFPQELLDTFMQGGFPVTRKSVNLNGTAHVYWPDKYQDPFEPIRRRMAAQKAQRDRFWAWVGSWLPWLA